jgi:uncharacterized membrane protein HdeD (DUF308 family)
MAARITASGLSFAATGPQLNATVRVRGRHPNERKDEAMNETHELGREVAMVVVAEEAKPSDWWKYIVVGVGLLVVGAFAVGLPFAASLAAEVLIAVLLLFAGAIRGMHAYHTRGMKGTALNVAASMLYIIAGVVLVVFPITGLYALTLVLAAVFVLESVLGIMLAVMIKPGRGWGWTLAGSIVALALAVVIVGGFPATAVWTLGLLLGIDLIFGGVAYFATGVSLKGA